MRSPRCAALLGTLVCGLGLASVTASAASGSAANGVEVVAAPMQAVEAVTLHLVDQTFGFGPDGTFELAYELTGLVDDPLELIPLPEPSLDTPTTNPADPDAPSTTTESPPPPPELPQLTVEVTNYQPVTNPADLTGLIGSDVEPSAFHQISDVVDGVAIDARPLAERSADGTVTFTLDVGTDVENSVEELLKFDRPGLWPIRVQLLIGDPADNRIVATAGTVVQRLPGELISGPPPIDLAVVVATNDPAPHGSATDDEAAKEQFTDAVELADALDAPVALEVPPSLVAAAVATPENADRIGDALIGDELLAMPLVPLDVSAAVAAGRADAYTRLVIGGVDVLTESVPGTPTRRDVWISTKPLSAAGAQHLRDLGVRFLIFPQEVYRSTIGGELPERDLFVNAALPDGGRIPILLVDDLSEQLTTTAADAILTDATPTEWAVGALTTMIAKQSRDDIAATPSDIAAGARTERSRILSTPDLSAPDSRLLVALDSLASTTPAVRFVGASSLTGVTDTQHDRDGPIIVDLPETAGPSLTNRIELIDASSLTMASAASMLPPDDKRPAAWAAELDGLISTGYSDADVLAATSDLDAEADRLRGAVVLPEPFTFTLTGREGTIEARLTNLADEPLIVVLHPESSKVNFPAGDQTVTLRPLDETSVIVPIEARSNGTSAINLSVQTPAGEPLDEPVTLTARVTALTGLGQVLTVGFVLVLLTWWISHWRSRRQDHAHDDGHDPDESTGSAADPEESTTGDEDRLTDVAEVESDSL